MGTTDKCAVAVRALEEAGYEAVSYSGRGMYGEKCVGVRVGSAIEAGELTAVVGHRPTTDSMGMGVIAYWPAISWVEE
jgi:hypothetical protein